MGLRNQSQRITLERLLHCMVKQNHASVPASSKFLLGKLKSCSLVNPRDHGEQMRIGWQGQKQERATCGESGRKRLKKRWARKKIQQIECWSCTVKTGLDP